MTERCVVCGGDCGQCGGTSGSTALRFPDGSYRIYTDHDEYMAALRSIKEEEHWRITTGQALDYDPGYLPIVFAATLAAVVIGGALVLLF